MADQKKRKAAVVSINDVAKLAGNGVSCVERRWLCKGGNTGESNTGGKRIELCAKPCRTDFEDDKD